LGLGIDVPDIRVVLHIEMPATITDYAQQSGRAGRDGSRSEAMVLQIQAEGTAKRIRPLVAQAAAMESYVSGRVCRRVVLDSMMDGREDRDGCEDGEELCDVCQRRSEEVDLEELDISEDGEEVGMRERELAVQEARRQAISRAAEGQEEFQLFQRRLEQRLLDGCIFCLAGSGAEDRGHSGLRCPRALGMGGKVCESFQAAGKMERFLRRWGVVERFGCCIGCFVPQELCEAWEEDGVRGGWQKRSGAKCQYEGIVVSTIAFVWTSLPNESNSLYRRFGFQEAEGWSEEERTEQVWRWMGRRVDWAGLKASNICRVFMEMAEDN